MAQALLFVTVGVVFAGMSAVLITTANPDYPVRFRDPAVDNPSNARLTYFAAVACAVVAATRLNDHMAQIYAVLIAFIPVVGLYFGITAMHNKRIPR